MMRTKFLFQAFVCFFILLPFNALKDDAPLITTNYGVIQGSSDKEAFLYLGIPFAMPPVNNLRWEEPIGVTPWYPQILNATEFKPACPQLDCTSRIPSISCPTEMSEDCLYLNVFVPKTVKLSNEKKAVLVFIHGGNYVYGGGHTTVIDGRRTANFTDVIFVTLQYRLGALGFLVTGLEEDQIHGNFGIKDQRMALKWIYENIENFGGDLSRITIFGQSAGAQSVLIHLLSLDMQSYFTNVIIQSSPISIPFREFEETMALYLYFADILNCPARDILCLRNKSIDDILNAQTIAAGKLSSFKLPELFEPWTPWLDGDLIKGQILEIEKWNKNNFTIKPFIIGTLPEECYLYITFAWQKPLTVDEYIAIMLATFKQYSIKVLEHFQIDFKNPDQRNLTSTIGTRWIFSCSSRRFLEQAISYSQSNMNFYLYVFDYPFDFLGWDNFTSCYGHTCHGTDMPYTFDNPDDKFTSAGHALSLSHITYWTNFAKFNNPNANDTLFWPAYTLKDRKFLRFKNLTTIESNYIQDDCDFFDTIGYFH